MLSYFTSIGASSTFEKNRLILTSKTLQAPEEHIMKKLLKTFQGDDDQTRSQFAFATIIKKIQTSDSNDNWIYLLKNLLILDRVLTDMCFIEEISNLDLPTITTYVERSSKYSKLKTNQILKQYWKLIKFTAKLYTKKNHILCFPRSQRSQFLQNLSSSQILDQIQSLEELFSYSFSIVSIFNSNQQQVIRNSLAALQKSPLIQYLYLQIVYKLYKYYSSQLLCVYKLFCEVSKDTNLHTSPLSLSELKKFKGSLQKFKMNATFFISFADRNKNVKGFQVINYRELDPMRDFDLIKTIDSYINEKMNNEEIDLESSIQNYISEEKMDISVQFKTKVPQIYPKENQQSRKPILRRRQKDEDQENNSFTNWISNFSQDFPQQEIMTLDLIMLIKEEQSNENSAHFSEEVIMYPDRSTVMIDNSITINEFNFKKPQVGKLEGKFINIYSGLETGWHIE